MRNFHASYHNFLQTPPCVYTICYYTRCCYCCTLAALTFTFLAKLEHFCCIRSWLTLITNIYLFSFNHFSFGRKLHSRSTHALLVLLWKLNMPRHIAERHARTLVNTARLNNCGCGVDFVQLNYTEPKWVEFNWIELVETTINVGAAAAAGIAVASLDNATHWTHSATQQWVVCPSPSTHSYTQNVWRLF